MASASLNYEVHQYGEKHELQRIGVWTAPDAESKDVKKTWIIYIHGGAWRDFRIDHKTFIPTIDAILSSPQAVVGPAGSSSSTTASVTGAGAVAGFASIDYRLSPHPQFPQDRAKTPAREYRDAFHPDHIRDVWSALKFLQAKYGFGSDYVLVGHSAGATLALQMLMSEDEPSDDEPALPRAIVGLEGIYDLQGLVDRLGPAYAELFVGAFGDSAAWEEVSPLRFTGNFKKSWASAGELAVLGWGPDDELIDAPEIEGMSKRLEEDGVRTVVWRDLKGTHDGMWEDGKPFAEVILKTLALLRN